MKKGITFVLLISFIGILWAQHDTCLKNENKTTDSDEESVVEQSDEVQEDQLGSLKRPPSFISTPEYYASEQDTTSITEKRKINKWCIAGVGLFVCALVVLILVWEDPGFHFDEPPMTMP